VSILRVNMSMQWEEWKRPAWKAVQLVDAEHLLAAEKVSTSTTEQKLAALYLLVRLMVARSAHGLPNEVEEYMPAMKKKTVLVLP